MDLLFMWMRNPEGSIFRCSMEQNKKTKNTYAATCDKAIS